MSLEDNATIARSKNGYFRNVFYGRWGGIFRVVEPFSGCEGSALSPTHISTNYPLIHNRGAIANVVYKVSIKYW